MMDQTTPSAESSVPQPSAASAAKPSAPKAQGKPSARPKTNASSSAIWATGRRKEAIARVRLLPGAGVITVNRRTCENYFPNENLRLAINQPLVVANLTGKYDILANVEGGGLTGQAGAIRLGIARALVKIDELNRPKLRAPGLLTRDPRAKERKKYGQKGARKRFQWTKR